MKKSVLYSVLMLMSISVMSQNWIYVNGTVTDSVSGNPVPDHEVTVFSDSVNGVYYYNVVMTDSVGYYFDDVPVLSSTGTVYVRTLDCHNFPHYGAIQFDPANNTYTQDFQICTEVLLCDAYFYYSQVANLTLHFIDLSQGNPTAWYWSFGDGITSTEQHPTHTYAAGGTYTIYFNMSNDSTGCNDSFSRTIDVADSNNLSCQAHFFYHPDSSNTPPYYYHFIDQSIGNINAWFWSFGDGDTSSLQSPYHAYQEAGTYLACLNVAGADSSCYDFTCQEIVVGGGAPCEAQFYYYPYPQESPDSFHFIDLSTGNVTAWIWSFGDGTSSTEQFPFHTYSGPGTYEACLVIIGTICADTTCQTIVISDTVYQQIYGQVFAGNFPLQQGYVQLYITDPVVGYTPFGEAEQIDSNGVYYFTLVTAGTYLIQAVPYDSTSYLPTYYGDVINWQEATQVTLGVPENPYNINLVQAGLMRPGPGSASGNISTGRPARASVDKFIMLLMNESRETIGFSRVNSYGYFSFPSLDYGIYYIRAELSGVSSGDMIFGITEQVPHVDIVLTYSENAIWGTDELSPEGAAVSVYPNPVAGVLSISLDLVSPAAIEMEIYTMAGRLKYQAQENCNSGVNVLSIPMHDYPAGIYALRIKSASGLNLTRKVVRAD
jgi:PKD repeat protein